jgi:hypothetical protein
VGVGYNIDRYLVPFLMFSLGFMIKTAIDKALAGKLKEFNDAVIEGHRIAVYS